MPYQDRLPSGFVEQACRNRMTESELPFVYVMLQTMFRDITQALATLNIRLPGTPAIGSLPISEVNASIRSVEDAQVVIVAINQGLFFFAYGMTKAAAFTVPYTNADGKIRFDLSPEASIRRLHSERILAEQFVGEILQ